MAQQTGAGGMPDADAVVKITDPGEINRAEQTRGDRLVIAIGNLFAWVFPALVLAITAQVILRKAGHNQSWLDDLQWWMYGVAMMVGMAYALATNSHVRVDIFHARFSRRKQAWIELFGLGWLFLPFLLLMFDVMAHYAYASVIVREQSASSTGLSGIYLLKSFLVVLFALALLAGFSALYRFLGRLTRPGPARLILAGLPSFLFIAYRLSHYALWWYVRLTRPELRASKIGRLDLMDNALWMSFAATGLLLLAALALERRRHAGGRG